MGAFTATAFSQTPFVGFLLDGVHSGDLGIIRTSEGNRYNTKLTPDIKDYTIEVPGGDGLFYYGSTYDKKDIPISFAFEGLTEAELKKIKTAFNTKKIHELVLAEEPEKIWSVKISSQATIKHLCFEENGRRVYRGEGNVVFTSLNPFARSPLIDFSIADSALLERIDTNGSGGSVITSKEAMSILTTFLGDERLTANHPAQAKLLNQLKVYGGIKENDDYLIVQIFNFGDAPISYKLTFDNIVVNNICKIEYGENLTMETKFSKAGRWQLNSHDQTLRHYEIGTFSKEIYNYDIITGNFFIIPVGISEIKFKKGGNYVLPSKIEYNLLYL